MCIFSMGVCNLHFRVKVLSSYVYPRPYFIIFFVKTHYNFMFIFQVYCWTLNNKHETHNTIIHLCNTHTYYISNLHLTYLYILNCLFCILCLCYFAYCLFCIEYNYKYLNMYYFDLFPVFQWEWAVFWPGTRKAKMLGLKTEKAIYTKKKLHLI